MNQSVIYEVLHDKMKAAPNNTAVFDGERTLTRMELEQLINTIAVKIPAEAHHVGIMMEHTVEMIASIFAVLKVGKAYVPVEPFFPQERIEFMMRDAGVDIILTNSIYKGKSENFPCVCIDPGMEAEEVSVKSSASPEDFAYILYTSGSTGKPKGVAVRNRNVCHYVKAFQNEFHPCEADTMLQYSVCSFDIFVEEVFTTLLSGAVLAIPPAETKEDIHALMEFVENNNITEISGFPYLLLEMNHLPQIPKSLRLLISGGDVLRASYITNLIDKAEIYNTYGPSETTVCASYYRCNDVTPLADGTYPVGKPVLGCWIEILDEHLASVKPGEIGEICILGEGVSAGYIGNRKRENEAFVTRQDGSVLYRSGDLGYLLPDENIAFLHRKDTQVMILGKRVEPVEVESVLCKCSEIEKAVVRPYMDEQNLSYMVAYVVLKQPEANLSTLKKEMARFLPNYMIPEFFVKMNDLPLNANGKVDTKALPVIMKEGAVA
ncbi:MAG: amino acid adenylation domain-containing protein [Bacteroides sp.]|nr:amino acid adenylation domain-containing protein [Bacteroides sp.]MCM1550255.1 amino acid adenylation domain-containing protein [Clostridium sp.]